MGFFKEDLVNVKAFAFDVDGVFSSRQAILHPSGEMMRTMNIHDGYVVQYAVKLNYPIAIITGGNAEAVRIRFKNLGVTDIYLRSIDKMVDFNDFIQKHNLNPAEVLYMGDDIPDYEIMKTVGFPTCPIDAAHELKYIARYISEYKGGEGCVRDVMEQVLKIHGNWMDSKNMLW